MLHRLRTATYFPVDCRDTWPPGRRGRGSRQREGIFAVEESSRCRTPPGNVSLPNTQIGCKIEISDVLKYLKDDETWATCWCIVYTRMSSFGVIRVLQARDHNTCARRGKETGGKWHGMQQPQGNPCIPHKIVYCSYLTAGARFPDYSNANDGFKETTFTFAA